MSRRKPPETQASLFGATPMPTVVRTERALPALPAPMLEAETDEAPRPKLRLVHSVLDWDVVVEAAGDDAFWVTRTRDTGTASSGMLFTRAQLERLIARASAALKVT